MTTSNDLERFLPKYGTGGPEQSHEDDVDGFPTTPQKPSVRREIPVSRIPMRRPTLIKKKSKN